MTNEKIIEFVKQVTDKKIRWVGWDEEDWFIPNGQIDVNTELFYGKSFYKGSHRETDNWNVSCGFKESHEYDLAGDGRWEFVREEAETFREQVGAAQMNGLKDMAENIDMLYDNLVNIASDLNQMKLNILNIIERLTIK